MSRVKHLFIINPAAGKKSAAEKLTSEIKSYFSAHPGEQYEIRLTEKADDAKGFVAECKEFDGEVRVYACGGDGTFHEAVNGAVGIQNVALCPIPVGSGNDFVRTFEDIPPDRFLDISACINGTVIPCDAMKIGGVYGVNLISVGLDAVTCKLQKKAKRIPFIPGGAAYKLALGAAFITSMNTKMSFEADGVPLDLGSEYAAVGVFGNGRFYGGGFKATPYAEISDGLIDLVIVKKVSRLAFLRYVGMYKRGDHIEGMPYVYYKRCKTVRVISEKLLPVQVDGEAFDMKDPVIEIVPAAIRLILPT